MPGITIPAARTYPAMIWHLKSSYLFFWKYSATLYISLGWDVVTDGGGGNGWDVGSDR